MIDRDSRPAWPSLPIGRPAASPAAPAQASRYRARDRDMAIGYRPDIEGLRGLAVAMVVVYHAFPSLRSGGFVGVDVFFVISGYLITKIVLCSLRSGGFSLTEFYRRRVLRIVPALLVVLTASCMMAWSLLLPNELQAFGSSVKYSSLLLANLFFALHTGGYFDPAADSNPLLHLWSLGVEEQFYLAWPLLLILARWLGATRRVLGLVIAASLAVSIGSVWVGSTPHFFNPISRAWELGGGGMLAAWQLAAPRPLAAEQRSAPRVRRLRRHGLSLLGLALVIAGGVCWTVERPIPGIWSLIPSAGALLLIGAGPAAFANDWLLAARPMRFIGQISYPLYLWHWPLFSFTRIVLGHAASPILAAVEIVLAVAAAHATFRLVEQPIRYGGHGRAAVPALLLGLALLAVSGVALQVPWIEGRLSAPIISRWDAAASDWRFSGDSRFDERAGLETLTVASRGQGKALFIGDSHIQQYWPRVKRVIDADPNSARSAIFVTFTAWPPLPGISRVNHARMGGDYFDRAMKLALQPDVDTVVIGAFWEKYFLGEYSPDHNVHAVYGVPQPPLQLDSPGTRTAFAQFQRDVATLVTSGSRVFIILSNPTSPLLIPTFPTELRFRLQLPDRIDSDQAGSIDAGPFESFVAPVQSRLRKIADETGATAVDPRLALCNGMTCPARDSNELPLYVDSNHLNGANARDRATFIDQMLLGPKMHLNNTPGSP